jgi:hypothetical protein
MGMPYHFRANFFFVGAQVNVLTIFGGIFVAILFSSNFFQILTFQI